MVVLLVWGPEVHAVLAHCSQRSVGSFPDDVLQQRGVSSNRLASADMWARPIDRCGAAQAAVLEPAKGHTRFQSASRRAAKPASFSQPVGAVGDLHSSGLSQSWLGCSEPRVSDRSFSSLLSCMTLGCLRPGCCMCVLQGARLPCRHVSPELILVAFVTTMGDKPQPCLSCELARPPMASLQVDETVLLAKQASTYGSTTASDLLRRLVCAPLVDDCTHG